MQSVTDYLKKNTLVGFVVIIDKVILYVYILFANTVILMNYR